MSKILKINRILLKENKKYLICFICTALLLSLFYFKFCNTSTDSRKILLSWMGGSAEQIYSFSILILKMSFISLIFIYIGRIIDQIKNNLIFYLAPRIGNNKKVIISLALVIIMQGILLVIAFQVAFFIAFAVFIHDINALIKITNVLFSYIVIECISMTGVILIYMIIDIIFKINNSLLIIIALYIINSVIPHNIPVATFTGRLGGLYCNGKMMQFGFLVCATTIIITIVFIFLIDKRKVELC